MIENYQVDYFYLKKQRFKDFCEFVSRLNNKHNKKGLKKGEVVRADGNIYREASDNWF